MEKWNSLLSVPKGTGSEKKLIYVIFGSTYLAVTPSHRSTWNISVVYQPSEALDGPLQLQNVLSLKSACVCVGNGALHSLHMWVISPHVLWCYFCMLCSFRSFLVPNPYLHTVALGIQKCLVCSLRIEVPHNSLFFPPAQTFWETTLVLINSLIFCSQGLWICICSSHTFSFCPECESFEACGRKDKAVVGVLLFWEMLLCQAFDEKIIAG